jgi:DNA polymerase-3 subunit gamma/tau
MVSAQGFNALLKLVEEPPDFLVFVFATTEPDKVLQTIRSRTHHYPFRLLPPSAMRKHLEHICTEEGVTVEPTVLPLVVRAGGGSARDALSILDQLLAGAGPNGVTYADAVALLGVTDAGLLDDMVDALAAGDEFVSVAESRAVPRSDILGHRFRRGPPLTVGSREGAHEAAVKKRSTVQGFLPPSGHAVHNSVLAEVRTSMP